MTADDFTRDLFQTFETIDRGGVLWSAEAPLPPSWFTADPAHDLDRATDLLCEADIELMDLEMLGLSGTAEHDQKRTRTARLSDLVDFLSSVVETLHSDAVRS